ncbi:MAG: hypothetical protein KAH95_13605, partial [Spirochaetales bacterium]|nr:hypothetical protein [Spirochaetales bacterium]
MFLAMGIGWSIFGVLNILTRSKIKENNAASALALILCFTIPMIDHLLKPNPQTISSFFPFL